jgi:hypothetical protein
MIILTSFGLFWCFSGGTGDRAGLGETEIVNYSWGTLIADVHMPA